MRSHSYDNITTGEELQGHLLSEYTHFIRSSCVTGMDPHDHYYPIDIRTAENVFHERQVESYQTCQGQQINITGNQDIHMNTLFLNLILSTRALLYLLIVDSF
jgi:hypothetical protein